MDHPIPSHPCTHCSASIKEVRPQSLARMAGHVYTLIKRAVDGVLATLQPWKWGVPTRLLFLFPPAENICPEKIIFTRRAGAYLPESQPGCQHSCSCSSGARNRGPLRALCTLSWPERACPPAGIPQEPQKWNSGLFGPECELHRNHLWITLQWHLLTKTLGQMVTLMVLSSGPDRRAGSGEGSKFLFIMCIFLLIWKAE